MWKKILKWLNIRATNTSKKQESQSNTVADNSERSLSIERDRIENTPFVLVGTEEHGYWLTLGKHRLTNVFKTKKEVHKELNERSWNLMTAIMMAFIYDRDLIDKALSKDTAIPPDEKAQQMAMQLNEM